MTGLKQKIILLDPWDIAASKLNLPVGHFNPLDWIKAGDPDAAENAFLLADALVMSDAKCSDPFWDEEAKTLLVGVILYVATTEEEAANRHLGRVRDILTLDDESLKELLTKMFMRPNPVVSSTGDAHSSERPQIAQFSAGLRAVAHALFGKCPFRGSEGSAVDL
jgi:type IV secretion system protein VirD4